MYLRSQYSPEYDKKKKKGTVTRTKHEDECECWVGGEQPV